MQVLLEFYVNNFCSLKKIIYLYINTNLENNVAKV